MGAGIMNDAGRIGFLVKGDYSGTTTYDFLDVVYHNGSSYVAKKTTIGNTPEDNNEYWQIFAKGSLSPVTGVKGNEESEYRHGNVNLTAENIGALSETGDTANNTVAFTSGDTTDPSVWVDVETLTSGEKHSLLFSKISNMFRNTRFLRKLIGTTSISGIGDGTVTGAIHDLNTDFAKAITTDNIGQQSVNYATSAGSAVDQTARNAAAAANNNANTRAEKKIASGGWITECTDGVKTALYFNSVGNLNILIQNNGDSRYVDFRPDGLYVNNSKKISW